MRRRRMELSRRYLAAMRKHLADGPRAGANSAEKLGRHALSAGLGTLDLARSHEQALKALLAPKSTMGSRIGKVAKAKVFFVETLAPIEKTRRAAVESKGRISRTNEALSRRTVELAAANRRVRQEIVQRHVLEHALKRSKRHYDKLLEQSHQLQGQLRRVSHRILSADEAERREISRELHGEIAQYLAGINITLTTLTNEATVSTRGLKKKIARTQRFLEESMKTVNRFTRELRPPVLGDMGLIPALHSHLREFVRTTHLRIRFAAVAAVERLDGEKRTVLYRVAQEALANVAKHAQATLASVKLTRQPDGFICLEIHDNGKSFQVRRVLGGRGSNRWGLLGMRERVEMVGGRFTVESAPGRGTTVRAQIPFKKSTRNHSILPVTAAGAGSRMSVERIIQTPPVKSKRDRLAQVKRRAP